MSFSIPYGTPIIRLTSFIAACEYIGGIESFAGLFVEISLLASCDTIFSPVWHSPWLRWMQCWTSVPMKARRHHAACRIYRDDRSSGIWSVVRAYNMCYWCFCGESLHDYDGGKTLASWCEYKRIFSSLWISIYQLKFNRHSTLTSAMTAKRCACTQQCYLSWQNGGIVTATERISRAR